MTEYQEFYDSISDDYDAMTSDQGRWDKERPFLLSLVEEFGWKKVLVAGCGTGGEAIAFAQMGVQAVGVDGSESLLEIARSKAAATQVDVAWLHDDLRSLKHQAPGNLDAVVCRGNTLPHFLTADDLAAALIAFRKVTCPGGKLVLGWLNYHRILMSRERLVGVREFGDKVILRFYDFLEDLLVFNIVTLGRASGQSGADGKASVSWNSTALKPWTLGDVEPALAKAGWAIEKCWGGTDRAEFDAANSHDVLVICASAPSAAGGK